MKILDILKQNKEVSVHLKGWVLNNRGNDKIRFITMNDGTNFDGIQIVLKNDLAILGQDSRKFAAIEIKGKVVLTPGKPQPMEVICSSFILLKNTDTDYPIQKKGIKKEVLREIPHLRHHTNLFRAVMRVRSTLMLEIHNFFNDRGFLNVSSPIITPNDGEGAGEVFKIKNNDNKDFFSNENFLTVTGQLQAESYALGFGDVYTFGPTFRAENSNTQRHASEFWMLEPEMAFTNIDEAIVLADTMLKQVIKNVITKHKEEFKFLESFVDENVISKLNYFLDKPIQKIEYKEAIKQLEKYKDKFENKDLSFGVDLSTEHEKFLCSDIYKGPVAIVNFPSSIKAFYMKQNKDGETVSSFDLLVPGVGELIGGSERECDFENLKKKMDENNIDFDSLEWYADLRRFGQYKSSGFGLGFERLVMYVTGIENIRDVIPFPRTPGLIKV